MTVRRRWVSAQALSIALAIALGATAAEASLRKEGAWPATERNVTLELRGVPRGEAVKKLADAAGWSLVFSSPPSDPVDVALKQQPADKVLEVLLGEGDYVARRDGTMVSIAATDAGAAAPPPPATTMPQAPTPPTPPTPPAAAPPAPPPPPPASSADARSDVDTRGRDRVITGGSLRVEKGEIVHDVAVIGGSVDVWGTVTGDVAATGGSVHIHEGAVVRGDATAVGGSLTIDDGARVDGDTNVIAGSLKRAEGAKVHGGGRHKSHADEDTDRSEAQPVWKRAASAIGSGITRTALLFVLGAMLLALASPRMEQLQVEIAGRPMRSFALGVLGVLGSIVMFIALCVTVIGIPVALIGLLLAGLLALAGMCAAVQTIGRGIVGHRSSSVYVHLAAGCALLLVVGLIPYLGNIAIAVTALVGVGSVVATRAAGMFASRAPASSPLT